MRKSAESISERRERLAQQDAQEAGVRAAVEAFEDIDLERSEKMAQRDHKIGAALVNGMSISKASDITGLSPGWLSKIRRAYEASLAITDDED